MKITAISLALSLASFLSCFYLFSSQSFYPYKVNSRIQSELTSYLDERHFFPYLKSPNDFGEDSFYIDEVIKNSDGSLGVMGRFFEHVKNNGTAEIAITRAIKAKIIDYMIDNFCSESIDGQKGHLKDQLEKLAPHKIDCRRSITNEVEKLINVSQTTLTDADRLKRILFISLVISVFFGAAVFTISESISSFKNAKE